VSPTIQSGGFSVPTSIVLCFIADPALFEDFHFDFPATGQLPLIALFGDRSFDRFNHEPPRDLEEPRCDSFLLQTPFARS
jgi:hypothetical protein